MKRITYIWSATTVLAVMLVSFSNAQTAGNQNANAQSSTPQEPSLGKYARSVRKDKNERAAKEFDNDNLPRQDKLNVVGRAPEASPDSQAAARDSEKPQTADKAEEKPKIEPGQSAEERQKAYDQWKEKISGQQEHIDALSRELDLEQREFRLRVASYYGDAGQRLRNEGKWEKENADYQQKIANKQKAIEDAKQKLSDLQEEARKSGAPSSVREGNQQ